MPLHSASADLQIEPSFKTCPQSPQTVNNKIKEWSIVCAFPGAQNWYDLDNTSHQLLFAFSPQGGQLTYENDSGGETLFRIVENILYLIPAGLKKSMTCDRGAVFVVQFPKNHQIGPLLKPQSISLIRVARSSHNHTALLHHLLHLVNCLGISQMKKYNALIVEIAKAIIDNVMIFMQSDRSCYDDSFRNDRLTQTQFDCVDSYMRNNLDRKVDIRTLAGLVSLSPSQFMRKFKNSLNISAMDYYCRIRMASAKEMLQSGRYHISEVAAKLGFSNQSMFTRHCKKYLFATPKQLLNKSIMTSADHSI